MCENKAQGLMAGQSGRVGRGLCRPDTQGQIMASVRGGKAHAVNQRRTCRAPGLTMLVGVPLMKLMTLSNAAPKYSS